MTQLLFQGFRVLLLLCLSGVIFSDQVLAQTAPAAESSSRKRNPRPKPVQALPFFDNETPSGQQPDLSPPPPVLTPFDQAVLRTCGALGSKVSIAAFDRLLTYYPDVVRKAKLAVGGELFPGRSSDAQFREDLVSVWMNGQGFEHIYCGELEGATKIGGLHFHGRYLQIQQAGGGRLPNNASKEEVVPGVVYTLGVVIRKGNQTYTDDLKGYPYVTNALEMFLETTKAFKDSRDGACLHPVKDAETGASYQAVFVRRQNTIITFYPDATPQGKPCKTS